ncbi:hypothetical protein EB796_020882 [Bugula neritina]|uniref:Uncharacterized protein n=1 Tax=Bugula neritina TaxID=10212 RepID=A0A7J7J580_BUGNE|nr:hypothetical protein EB796_020882 [Bugula neritina]
MRPLFKGSRYVGLLHLIGLNENFTPKERAESLINDMVKIGRSNKCLGSIIEQSFSLKKEYCLRPDLIKFTSSPSSSSKLS